MSNDISDWEKKFNEVKTYDAYQMGVRYGFSRGSGRTKPIYLDLLTHLMSGENVDIYLRAEDKENFRDGFFECTGRKVELTSVNGGDLYHLKLVPREISPDGRNDGTSWDWNETR